MVIRLSKSSVGQEEKLAVDRVLDLGYLGMGDEVRLFEQELSAYIGHGRQVICVATGTAALHLSLSCLGIGPGDEVLIPTITYVACFQAVSATGAKPVPCEVRLEDGFVDVHDLERRITSRTRAIMPVHYASGASDLQNVYRISQKYGLRVIEDAAHSFGGTFDGQPTGAVGDVVCFSFDGIKNITCGEGGAVVTSDDQLAQRVRDARLLGVEQDSDRRYEGQRSWTFDVHHQGFRYHMSNIMAAIGREQLKKLPVFAERRRLLARNYVLEISQLDGMLTLDLEWPNLVPHIFVARVLKNNRDAFVRHLNETSIETGYHYQPNHLLSLYASDYRLPLAEKFAEEIVSLPLHPEMESSDQAKIMNAIHAFFHKV